MLDGERSELAELPVYGSLAWSPEGTHLAVETWDGVKSQVVVLDATSGRSLYRLDAGQASSAAPPWSPDGGHLAFVRGTAFGASKVFVATADGDTQREIGELDAVSVYPPLAWSPDGSRVLASTGDYADGEAWVFALEGGRPVRLLSGVMAIIGWR